MWPETAAVTLAGAAGFFAWAVRGRSAQIFGPSVWRVPAGRRRIALTFDDGPSESTPALLDLLRAHGATATFFVCGQNAARLPDVLRRIANEGHEIGNHTWSHPRLDFRSPAFIRDEIARTQAAVREITGVTPVLFRAPYGVRWFGLAAAQREFALRGVMWTAIGRDWKLPAQGVAARLAPAAVDGAILCLHDGRVLASNPDISNTLGAVAELLPRISERQLTAVSVSELSQA